MVETETYFIHLTAFIYQPVATPHQSFLAIGSEVPIVKKSSFPSGEAKNSKTFRYYQSVKCSVSWVLGGFAAAGRQVGDPYRLRSFWLICTMQYTPSASLCSAAPSEREPRVLRTRERRAAKSRPYGWRCKTIGTRHSSYHTPSASHSLSSSPRGGAKAAPPQRVRGRASCPGDDTFHAALAASHS